MDPSNPYDDDIISDALERFPSSFIKKSPSIPKSPNDLEDDDTLSDEEEEILIPNLNPSPSINSETLIPTKIKLQESLKGKKSIPPVIKEEIPSLESLATLPYKNLIQKELSESEEMFECRSKIADLLANLKLKAGGNVVSLDSLAILNYSRMINNHLWYDISYEKEAQATMLQIMEMINVK